MTAPPCAGKWELFDSIELDDHVEARALCANCPIVAACGERLREAKKLAQGVGGQTHCGPQGTWAGQLVGRKPARKLPPIEHGTPRGAWTHRNRKQPVCNLCKAAERLHLAQMRARLKEKAA